MLHSLWRMQIAEMYFKTRSKLHGRQYPDHTMDAVFFYLSSLNQYALHRQSAGSARFHVLLKNGSGRILQDLLRGEEYCHKLCVLFVLLRFCKGSL